MVVLERRAKYANATTSIFVLVWAIYYQHFIYVSLIWIGTRRISWATKHVI
jgi:hypothetical protein